MARLVCGKGVQANSIRVHDVKSGFTNGIMVVDGTIREVYLADDVMVLMEMFLQQLKSEVDGQSSKSFFLQLR